MSHSKHSILSFLEFQSVIPQFCKPLMDSIVTKGMTVREFKKQMIREAYNQGIEYPLQLDRCLPSLLSPSQPQKNSLSLSADCV